LKFSDPECPGKNITEFRHSILRRLTVLKRLAREGAAALP